MTRFSSLEKFFLILTILGGSLILFIPVQNLLIAFLGLITLVCLLAKPKICFYLMLFTIPFTERLRILPISFSPNDIFILLSTISILINMLSRAKSVSLKTSIDKWNIALILLYFIAGITSLSSTGVLTSFKFLEAISAFYMTIYLIRTKQISLSNIIKVFLFTGLFQAIWGILQSSTGQFGALSQFPRGYLGYLGIGPTVVWQACGSVGGTGGLSEFLVDILLLILPFLNYINKKKRKIIMTILLIAIYMGYTKLSLFSLLVCGLIYYNYSSKNKTEAVFKVTSIVGVTSIIGYVLANTAFVDTADKTISGRLDIWSYPIYALTNNMKYLWLGSGLNSYWEIVDPLLPLDILKKEHFYMLAHNYYLLTVQEMGLVGAIILFSFFIFMCKKCFENFKKFNGFYKHLNMAVLLFIITIFTSSCFGQFYYATYTKVLIYIFLAMIFAKEFSVDKTLRGDD